MEIRSKEFSVVAEAVDAAPADLALINQRFALRPLGADEVYVRRLALCNDQYDRTAERFPRFYLERFAETLPGKSLLAHHERGSHPLGRFFRTSVEVQPGHGGKGPITWLYCWAYLLKTPGNEEIRAQIDAGVYSHVSVGFRWADLTCDLCARSYFHPDCPHLIDQQYEEGRCTATYSGDADRVEAVEASLVYLGAQYGAVITKSDDRASEKWALAGRVEVGGLAADGRAYREELRREIRRLAGCVGARREAEMLVEALGDAGAMRLREVLQSYAVRFDAAYPLELHPGAVPPGDTAPEPDRPGEWLQRLPQSVRVRV